MNKWFINIGATSLDLSYLEKDSLYSIYRTKEIENYRRYYLFLGDLHGNIKASIILAIRLQTLLNVPLTAVFQVGDFGYWPSGLASINEDPHYKKEDRLDFFEISQSVQKEYFFSLGKSELETLKAPLYFIRGNHEDFDRLSLMSKDKPSEVTTGIYFIPDYFHGVIENLNIMAIGGIIADLERGKGKKAKVEFKKNQQKIKTDKRYSDASLLVQLNSTAIDLLLTHSGLASREDRQGSKQLEAYLYHSNIPLHFYGHHHKFSIGSLGANTVSIGLRNLDIDARGILRKGSFALVSWNNRNSFEVYSDYDVKL
jgi:hypothetical protein